MNETIKCQGRQLGAADLIWLQNWIAEHGDWSRARLAKELCREWNWCTASGQIKNYAARSFLIKLEQRSLINLPPLQLSKRRTTWSKSLTRETSKTKAVFPLPPSEKINVSLSKIKPLRVVIPNPKSYKEHCYNHYLVNHHYLGFSRTVGENLKYLVSDCTGRNLACLLFGSAAWKTIPRDSFIGWSDAVRQKNVNFLTNNTRFLILPWVRVPHLASHILGLVMRRLCDDWHSKYAHPIHIVETFVEHERFRGTCYRAANWIYVGQTKGRSRQDRYSTLNVPIKDIYLYPLILNFREKLSNGKA